MQESYTVEERYRDLIGRAEVYFRALLVRMMRSDPNYDAPGVVRWLDDLSRTRDREIVELYTGKSDDENR